MGFFNWIRQKRKKKDDLEEFENVGAQSFFDEGPDGRRNVQEYIIECCGQIAEAAKELEEEKAEYRIVTDYLNDIQFLENLPEPEFEEIRSTAESVQALNAQRDAFQNAEKKISYTQFMQMQQEEDSIPDAIKKLKENEEYQNTVKRDMNYLEGEKTEWYYNKLERLRQQKLLKNMSFILLGLVTVIMIVLVVMQEEFYLDTTYAWIIFIAAAAALGFFIFYKMTVNQTEIRRSEVNMNYAIVLLNKIKFRYVNITNAVDYAREKYHVKNANEFNYIWEQYLNEVREREKFRQANEDLEYFGAKLIRLLNRYRLYDANVWVNQSSALLDNKEMVEVKHNLVVRRQKLRSRIEYNSQNIKDRKAEIDEFLKKQKLDTPEIREMIKSIEQVDAE